MCVNRTSSRRLCWIDCICVILSSPFFVYLFFCSLNISGKSLIRFWQSWSKFSPNALRYTMMARHFFSFWSDCFFQTFVVGNTKQIIQYSFNNSHSYFHSWNLKLPLAALFVVLCFWSTICCSSDLKIRRVCASWTTDRRRVLGWKT